MSVKCGACGTRVRRKLPEMEWDYQGCGEVFTRTLVDGEFVPSCSADCAGVLRSRMRSEKGHRVVLDERGES